MSSTLRPRKRKERYVVEVEVEVEVEEGAKAELRVEISELWVVPKRATGDADIGDVYGVALEDEDEATDEEDWDRAGEVASSSSSDLPCWPALYSTSAPS